MSYWFRSEKEVEDTVDSDFDIDETDEPIEDKADEEKEVKKKKTTVGVYKVG